MKKRVLLLGVTGIAKDHVYSLLEKSLQQGWQVPGSSRVLDFEKEYIQKHFAEEFHTYLDVNVDMQRQIWHKAWHLLTEETSEYENLVVGMHAVVARPLFSVRSPISVNDVQSFGITHIVTLIDDVYDVWHRTNERAKGLSHVGVPTLSELVEARRSEIIVGDIIANHVSTESLRVRNYVMAVKHPERCLLRLLVGEIPTSKRIYVSHPISEPRRQFGKGNDTDIDEINELLSYVAQRDRESEDSVFFYPLTIDELPMQDLLGDAEQTSVFFNRITRWDVSRFFGEVKLLSDNEALGSEVELPYDQVKDVARMVKADIRSRDFRLIEQSRRLVVINPWFRERRPRGVRAEIDCALRHGLTVHIWQDQKHDPAGDCYKHYGTGMGGTITSTSNYRYIHDSLEECIDKALWTV